MRKLPIFWRRGLTRDLCGLALISLAVTARAHPMGNFAICHYAHISVGRGSAELKYIVDFAEIPTLAEMQTLDPDGGVITAVRERDYLAARSRELVSNLQLVVNGAVIHPLLRHSSLRAQLGAGGLKTLQVLLELDYAYTRAARLHIQYSDGNYPARTGWKEIIATAAQGVRLLDSDVPRADASNELTHYPLDISPPQALHASLTTETTEVLNGSPRDSGSSAITAGQPRTLSSPSAPSAPRTPWSAFTQAIAVRTLTPLVMLVGVGLAFIAGSLHALSPGHGKTMVAAYLVGTRDTAKHAALLGLIVTVTHTSGVFALGLVTLAASRYIVPEKLYPVLSALSGLAICLVGLWLFVTRVKALRAAPVEAQGITDDQIHTHMDDPAQPQQHHHEHVHEQCEVSEPRHVHSHTDEHDHGQEQPHDHMHDHSPTLEHSHGGLWHSHGPGGHTHQHVPNGPVNLRTLVTLGVSGGIIPCPSALIVLLAAINLHRVAYGMLLITAFSIGLATVLIATGMVVVYCSSLFNRVPKSGVIMARLPVASAALIAVLGAVLVVRALAPGV